MNRTHTITHSMNHVTCHVRDGVTLMETIFAIGVVLTGLVGLTALIPIAAGNAKATLELDRSVNEAVSVAATAIANNYTSLSQLAILDEPLQGSLATPIVGTYPSSYSPYAYYPNSGATGDTTGLRTLAWKLRTQMTTSPLPPGLIGKLESPGYGHFRLGAGLVSGICIDPLGIPDSAIVPGRIASGVSASDSAYAYSRFPYYNERFTILGEPNAQIVSPTGPTSSSSGEPVTTWPMSPRMWRATIRLSSFGETNPVPRSHITPPLALRSIFTGFGEISGVAGAEENDPESVLLARSTLSGNTSIYTDGQRVNSSQYTWFATLAPPFFGGNIFRQSIVVVKQRVPPTPQRAGDPLALNLSNYTTASADENPKGERLTWVGDAIGFSGGSGGDVQLFGPNAISSDITAGEWVMLSRQPHVSATGVPTGVAVHRWYRILRVDPPTYNPSFSWNGSTYDIWARWVSLAGPDWVFEDGVASAVDDTFCTIVSGAVSVIESEVVIE